MEVFLHIKLTPKLVLILKKIYYLFFQYNFMTFKVHDFALLIF